ncbi:winged helix-turn-helix domain-containing protein [Lysobacter sp. 1R34A]|uniref:winged helix-turn-helix domain-containing protein n=1 Tax=Lysobacter sp. 1R34A TaxID=3445786 RepID=UPI003EEBB052
MTDPRTPPWPPDSRYLRTGDLLIDLRYRRVNCGGVEVELPQRLFDLLALLMAEPHTLHGRAELFARLWPGLVVEDANLTQNMWLLRKALGEPRKGWIRTVAKGGYVFEPPGPVEWFAELPAPAGPPASTPADPPAEPVPDVATATDTDEVAAAQPAAAVATESSVESPVESAPAIRPSTSVQPRWRRWARPAAWAAAAIALLAVAGALLWFRDSATAGTGATAVARPLAVALIEVEDRANATRWPVKLLREWLRWKLGSLPEVTLMTEADLAADGESSSPKVVFLSSGIAAGDASQVLIRARFHDQGREQRLEVKGPVSQVPAMVDTLSQQVMAKLVPGRADAWPALNLAAPAARRYADAVEAIDRRDWIAAAAISNEVVRQAPRFGLARMQLARAQSRLAQATSAIEQMQVAIESTKPVPAEVEESMRAEALAMDPRRHQQAREAYAKLVARYPAQSSYALQYAQLLSQTGELQQAMSRLSTPDWDHKPMGTRVARLLLISEIHQLMGEPERMREYARSAERITREAGAGWELEHGNALLMIAVADTLQYKERADVGQYEHAAKRLEAAGNRTRALYARFLAEATVAPGAASTARMQTLLAQARAGGYRRLEIDILARAAAQHFNAGDLPGYRRLLEEALMVTHDSGDVLIGHRLAMALLIEDIVGARLDSAAERLRQLRKAGLQGRWVVDLAHFDAALSSMHGRYAYAVAVLDGAEREIARLPAGGAGESRARIACLRAEARLPLGDLQEARSDWLRCAASEQQSTLVSPLVGRAHTEWLGGDKEAAAELLGRAQTALAALGDSPEGAEAAMDIATLLTRTGAFAESDRLYQRALPVMRAAQYHWLVAGAETGLAENAAARGDWATSRRFGAQARSKLPADAWSLTSRLDLLDIVAALAVDDKQRAAALASALHAQAQRGGDRLTQMELHSLMPHGIVAADCSRNHRDSMTASTGMRGASLAWLQPKSPLAAEPALETLSP